MFGGCVVASRSAPFVFVVNDECTPPIESKRLRIKDVTSKLEVDD